MKNLKNLKVVELNAQELKKTEGLNMSVSSKVSTAFSSTPINKLGKPNTRNDSVLSTVSDGVTSV